MLKGIGRDIPYQYVIIMQHESCHRSYHDHHHHHHHHRLRTHRLQTGVDLNDEGLALIQQGLYDRAVPVLRSALRCLVHDAENTTGSSNYNNGQQQQGRDHKQHMPSERAGASSNFSMPSTGFRQQHMGMSTPPPPPPPPYPVASPYHLELSTVPLQNDSNHLEDTMTPFTMYNRVMSMAVVQQHPAHAPSTSYSYDKNCYFHFSNSNSSNESQQQLQHRYLNERQQEALTASVAAAASVASSVVMYNLAIAHHKMGFFEIKSQQQQKNFELAQMLYNMSLGIIENSSGSFSSGAIFALTMAVFNNKAQIHSILAEADETLRYVDCLQTALSASNVPPPSGSSAASGSYQEGCDPDDPDEHSLFFLNVLVFRNKQQALVSAPAA